MSKLSFANSKLKYVLLAALVYGNISADALPPQLKPTDNATLAPGTRIRINSRQDVLPEITLSAVGVVSEPSCDYRILKDGPNGEALKNAEVGEPVYHEITCHPVGDSNATYCLSVFNCSIISDDKSLDYPIIDEMGCTTEPTLFESVEYASDLKAGIHGQAIRFHGSPKVQLLCQTRLLVKGPEENCSTKRPRCITNEYFIGSALKVNTPKWQ